MLKAQLEWTGLEEKTRIRLEKLTEAAHGHSDEAVLEARKRLFHCVPKEQVTCTKFIICDAVWEEWEQKVEEALKTWKGLLETLSLSAGNSSSFATDDLLSNIGELDT